MITSILHIHTKIVDFIHIFFLKKCQIIDEFGDIYPSIIKYFDNFKSLPTQLIFV